MRNFDCVKEETLSVSFILLFTLRRYKILFLDVLFPLDVQKIIFVDADQVTKSLFVSVN